MVPDLMLVVGALAAVTLHGSRQHSAYGGIGDAVACDAAEHAEAALARRRVRARDWAW